MKRLAKRLLKRVYSLLLPRGARNSLRLWTILDAADRAPALVGDFTPDPVLVLAPHMDDEVIGCGGTVRRHVLAGAAVTVVYMTDGRRGDPDLYAQGLSRIEIARKEGALVLQRKEESRRATELLGVGDLVFLDGPDGGLIETADLVARLARVLVEKKPKYVYLPAISDIHPDHWATNRIFHDALRRASSSESKGLVVRGYEVWTPLPANAMVDISSVADLKRKAIEAFPTQTKFVDYAHTALGLAAYRSMVHLNGRGYAEAFLETAVEEYRKLFDAVVVRRARGT